MEPWMTKGLEKAGRKVCKLYKCTLEANSSNAIVTEYKIYRNNYNRLKRQCMEEYYQTKVTKYRTNTKKLWHMINQIIKKSKHKGSIITTISIDGIKMYNPSLISEEFGKFYSSLGSSLASKIAGGMHKIDYYLDNMPRTDKSLVFKGITEAKLKKIIEALPNKTSQGHDQISNGF